MRTNMNLNWILLVFDVFLHKQRHYYFVKMFIGMLNELFFYIIHIIVRICD